MNPPVYLIKSHMRSCCPSFFISLPRNFSIEQATVSNLLFYHFIKNKRISEQLLIYIQTIDSDIKFSLYHLSISKFSILIIKINVCNSFHDTWYVQQVSRVFSRLLITYFDTWIKLKFNDQNLSYYTSGHSRNCFWLIGSFGARTGYFFLCFLRIKTWGNKN